MTAQICVQISVKFRGFRCRSPRSKKWLSQKEVKNYAESYFFLNEFETGQILRIYGNDNVCSNKWNGTNITVNSFVPQTESHTAKFKYFWCFEAISPEIDKNFSRSKKWLFQKEAKNYSESYFFLTSLKKGKTWRKVLIWWKWLCSSNQPLTPYLSFPGVLISCCRKWQKSSL